MNRRQLLKRLSEGSLQNVAFADMIRLVEGFGFKLRERVGAITSSRIRTFRG